MPYKRGDSCEITVVMEEVRLLNGSFRNFSGKEGMYNREGERSFGVVIPDEETADYLESCGYNVKWLKGREEGEEDTPWMNVAVNFKGARPPKITQVTSRGQVLLDEETVGLLDYADILHADLIVRPYNWTVQGKSGVRAYLQSMYVTIDEDPLEKKYAKLTDEGADLGDES